MVILRAIAALVADALNRLRAPAADLDSENRIKAIAKPATG